MPKQGVEPRDEQKFILPNWLEKYPGRHKPQTQRVLEELRSNACIMMAVRNIGGLHINDVFYSFHQGGDYTNIRGKICKNESLTAQELWALYELCSLMMKHDDETLRAYARVLMSTVADFLNAS